jgi:hypothetical protein
MKKFFKVTIDQDECYKTIDGVKSSLVSERSFSASDVVSVIELTPELELSQAIETVEAAGYLVQKEMSSDELEKEAAQLFELFTDNRDSFYKVLYQFIAANKRPKKIELSVKETGVLMSPAEINPGCTDVEFEVGNGYNHLSSYGDEYGKKIVISDRDFPRSFYKDIKTEIDYSKLQRGSIVLVNGDMCGFVDNKENTSFWIKVKNGMTTGKQINYSEIKSIEILKLPGDVVK